MERQSLASFDQAWPQPFDNSQRMWAFGKPSFRKRLVTVSWRSFGFYALNGTSTITFETEITQQTVSAAFVRIREENPTGRILLVLDNHSAHRAQYTRNTAEQLGITLVFLPPYSPFLNPIEPVWKSLKRDLSPYLVESADHFRALVTERFLALTHRLSFANHWIETFLPNIQLLR